MTVAVIALGSNLGDRLGYLRRAVAGLRGMGEVTAVSSLYETAPVGGPDQGSYLNAVVVLDTDLDPSSLLVEMHVLERQAERTRRVRWGPRTLDLDLIFHGEAVEDRPGLTLPHPRYSQRRFVLAPLAEVWPEPTDPAGLHLAEALGRVADQQLVRVQDPGWVGDSIETPNGGGEGDGDRPSHDRLRLRRGEGWVVAQALLLVLHLAVTLLTADTIPLPAGPTRAVGGLAVVLSLGLGAAGSRRLGRYLTPFPEPVAEGRLVTGGVYGLVRHPLYGAVISGAFGFALLLRSAPGSAVTVLIAGFFARKARHEERRLQRTYPDYGDYRRATPRRFIPYLW